ncbi:MAG: hypothetical protein WC695_03320 [Candidatus Omnitrophota bacterium]
MLIVSLACIGCCLTGYFLFLKPQAALGLQKRFYEMINWRIEPIDLNKEIRNTRSMGLLLMGSGILVFAYAVKTVTW